MKKKFILLLSTFFVLIFAGVAFGCSSAKLESISISESSSIQTVYYETNTEFRLNGATLVLSYSNGTSKNISIESSMLSEFDNSVGTHTCTITYEDKTTTFQYEVKAVEIAGIAIKNDNFKKEYLSTDTDFEINGSTIEVTYNNGTTETRNVTASMLSSFDNSVGTHTCTITYNGKTTDFTYSVSQATATRELLSIEVTTSPKTTYFASETDFDITGAILRLNYSDNSQETISITKSMLDPFNNTVGSHTCYVKYEDKRTDFTYYVQAVTLASISIKDNNFRTSYFTSNSAFEINGSTLLLTYNDGTTNTVNITAEMLGNFDKSTGAHACAISYMNKTTSFRYTVTAVALSFVSVKDNNFTTSYLTSATAFEINGSTLSLNYNDGTTDTVNITADMLSTFDNTAGTHTCTITHNGKTTTFEYVVSKPQVESITSVSGIRTKYFLGGTLDLDSATVYFTYEDGTQGSSAINSVAIDDFYTSPVGEFKMKITYEGKTYLLPYTVMCKDYITTRVLGSDSNELTNIPTMISLQRTSVDDPDLYVIKVKTNDGKSSYKELAASDYSKYIVAYKAGQVEITIEGDANTYILEQEHSAATRQVTISNVSNGEISVFYSNANGANKTYTNGDAFIAYVGEKIRVAAQGNAGYVATKLYYGVSDSYSYIASDKEVSFYLTRNSTCSAEFSEAKLFRISFKLKSINYKNSDDSEFDGSTAKNYLFSDGSYNFNADYVTNSSALQGTQKKNGSCAFSTEYKDGCSSTDEGTYISSSYEWTLAAYMASGSEVKINIGVLGMVKYAKDGEAFGSTGSNYSEMAEKTIVISDIKSVSSEAQQIIISSLNSRFEIVLEYTISE